MSGSVGFDCGAGGGMGGERREVRPGIDGGQLGDLAMVEPCEDVEAGSAQSVASFRLFRRWRQGERPHRRQWRRGTGGMGGTGFDGLCGLGMAIAEGEMGENGVAGGAVGSGVGAVECSLFAANRSAVHRRLMERFERGFRLLLYRMIYFKSWPPRPSRAVSEPCTASPRRMHTGLPRQGMRVLVLSMRL